MNRFPRTDIVKAEDGSPLYLHRDPVSWGCPWRGGKTITTMEDLLLDGSTGGSNIVSIAWIIHDWIVGCVKTGLKGRWAFDDGTPISTIESVMIITYILAVEDGQKFRAFVWCAATLTKGPRSPHGFWIANKSENLTGEK